MSNFKGNWDISRFRPENEPETEHEIKRVLEVQRALSRQCAQEIKKLEEQIKRHKARIREMEVKLRKTKKE